MRAIRCPDDPRGHTVVGCGHTFHAAPDDEGFYDCPACGMWFDVDRERTVYVTPRVFAGVLAVLALIVALSYVPDAFAGLTLKPDGAHYARPHHWYTNDGRQHRGGSTTTVADAERLLSNPALIAKVREAEHTLAVARRVQRLERKLQRHKAECRRLRSQYIVHHGLSTPPGLHGQTGCRKWRNDAQYHRGADGQGLPGLAGLLSTL